MASCSDPIPTVALVASFHRSPGQRRTADPLGAERWTTPHDARGGWLPSLYEQPSPDAKVVGAGAGCGASGGVNPDWAYSSRSAPLFSPSRLHFHGFRVGTCTDTNHYAYHCTRAHALLNSRSVKTQQTSVV